MIDLENLILHELSQGLSLTERPYQDLGEKYGVSEDYVFKLIQKHKSTGTIKRLGPIAQHRKFGFTQNAMVVFQVPQENIDHVAAQILEFPFVNLCYQRQPFSEWPYNLYCMIHGQSRETVLSEIDMLKNQLNLQSIPSETLFSTHAFKQTGANYLGPALDEADRIIINELQNGVQIQDHPFLNLSQRLGWTEETLIHRLRYLLNTKKLSRFGPMYDVEKFGGVFTLVAMEVPGDQFQTVADIVNSFKEVAHNYEREHKLNMWFVVATETKAQTENILKRIEQQTELKTIPLPKLEEYFLSLRFDL